MRLLFLLLLGLGLVACNKETITTGDDPQLIISFRFDDTADRLDNLGEPATIPPGNAGQSPDFETLGLHFVGLYSNKFTPYSEGITVLQTPTTEAGGGTAIDFEKEFFIESENDEVRVPLAELEAGSYEFIRASIGFQRYRIQYNLEGLDPSGTYPDDVDVLGTVASFLGFNTYIQDYRIQDSTVLVQSNKLQGYFGLESSGTFFNQPFGNITTGDAPQTTVPNPIDATSPVPAGSCVVTGQFTTPLIIPAEADADIRVEVVISINKSFEWEDGNGNGKFEPLIGEQVVDMGTRGVFPRIVE
jgi:hypothetical protein